MVKVTVTQKWYVTFRHPKMHLQTKFGIIPISNNSRDTIILKLGQRLRSVTLKWYETHRHPKMHSHTEFGIHTSMNIGDMHQTECQI